MWRLPGGTLHLVLLVLLTYAIRRWSILRRLGVLSLLRNIPFLRPYMKDVAKVQQVSQRANSMQGRMARYSPDVKGRRESKQAAVQRQRGAYAPFWSC
jgi:hypothetical protein